MRPTAFLRMGVWVCLALILGGTAFAQTTGVIRGEVKDPSGAVVPGANVTATLHGTATTRTVTTGADGSYDLVELPVGQYDVTIEAQGFKTFSAKGVEVTLGHVSILDAQLALGVAAESVTVEASALHVETTSTQLGAVVNDRAVTELPLNTRNTYQLLQLQPGVQSTVGANLFYGSDQAGVVSVNGGRGRANDFMVNGGDANDIFVNLPAIQPSPDAIEEFRVLTNTFDAEFGRNSGAVVNVVTKSGTNTLHGDVYDFFRNTILDSRNFFDHSTGDFKQNQFGGTLGGPIKKDSTFIFGSYEGRRTRQGISSGFVSLPTAGELKGDFSGIGAQNSQPQFFGTIADPFFASVLAARSGGKCNTDVMAEQAAAGLPQNGIVGGNPAPVALGGNGGQSFYSSIFPGEKIPTSCFDPTAVALLKDLPAPGFGNVVTNPDEKDREDQFTVRFDHKLSGTQQLAVYYYFNDLFRFQPFSFFQAAGANVPGFGDNNKTRFQQWNVSHTWTIGSVAVNEFRFTYFREGQETFDHPVNVSSDGTAHTTCPGIAPANCFQGGSLPNGLGGIPASGGITTTIPGHAGLPDIAVSGGFTIGNNFEGELPQIGNVFEWSDNFSRVLGKHSLKFGGDVSRDRFDQTLFFETTGLETVLSVKDLCHPRNTDTKFCTPSIVGVDDVGFADSYADYLLGYVNTYNQGGNQSENLRNTMVGLFAQDSWKIRSNLTLNYGLRWELNTPYGDLGHRLQTFRAGVQDTNFNCVLKPTFPSGATNPDFGLLTSLLGSTNCSPTGPANAVYPLGLVYPGDGGLPEGVTQTYYRSFAPRVGLAWSPGASSGWLSKLTGGPGKMSIRMGWGMFYNPIEQLVLEQMSAEPPFGGSNTLFGTLLNTPFEFASGGAALNGTVPAPNPFGARLSPPRGSNVDWSIFRPIVMFGQFQPNQRSQYSEQYNLTIQRELAKDLVFQIGYVGTEGHRLLLSHDLNAGNPQTCLDLIKVLGTYFGCGAFGADFGYTSIPAGTPPPTPGFVFHLPYSNGAPGGPNIPCPYFNAPPRCLVPFPNKVPISILGTRPFSSPFCEPTTFNPATFTGFGCPPDFVPVFTSIYAQDTVGNSNYNSLQVSLEKHFSHGLQFQAAYTFGRSIDNASSFENIVNPFNFRKSRSLSLFDARHRFVFSPYWELPIPKHAGFAGRVVNGWAVSGIITYQTGFPIRIVDGNDSELTTSDADFESVGEPNIVAPVHFTDPRKNVNASGQHLFFDSASFQPSVLGTFGNASRSLCCGPSISQSDISILKKTPISERFNTEFRAEFYNAFNHTQFLTPDGNFSHTGTFGSVSLARDPRLIQFALKLLF